MKISGNDGNIILKGMDNSNLETLTKDYTYFTMTIEFKGDLKEATEGKPNIEPVSSKLDGNKLTVTFRAWE